MKEHKAWGKSLVRRMKCGYDDNRNLLLRDRKILFFIIPKAGSSTLRKLMMNHYAIDDAKNLPQFQNIDLSKRSSVLKIAFVRNPWEKLVSLYEGKKQSNLVSFFTRNQLRHDTFENFVIDIAKVPDYNSDRHFRSQFTFITSPDGEFLVDQLLKFECFNAMLKFIFNDLKFIPHANKSKYENYRSYYSKDLQALFKKRYSEDIELFGFDFNKSVINLNECLWNTTLSIELKNAILTYKSLMLYKEYGTLKIKLNNDDFSMKKMFRRKFKRRFFN